MEVVVWQSGYWLLRTCLNVRIIRARRIIVFILLLLSTGGCGCDIGPGRHMFVMAGDGSETAGRFNKAGRNMLVDAPGGLCDSIIKVDGYRCEEHTVTTSDGFLLGLQHIVQVSAGAYDTNSSSRPQRRPPVYLQHGLLQGGDDWVLNPPQQSLAYILTDQGFNVWIGNMRCTRWSHGHSYLSPADMRFWDWSFDEHALIDMPTLVEYVVNATGTQVYYVGHSQGTIMALAAFSAAETKMSEMVKATVLLAPIAYMQHLQNSFLLVSADLMLDMIAGLFGTREFTPRNEVGAKLMEMACTHPNVFCDDLIHTVTGSNCCLNSTRVPYYLQWEPQSTSTKNLQHLAQMMRRGIFSKFDYGLDGNLAHYHQPTPPTYDLANILPSMKLLLMYGGQDDLADPRDVLRLIQDLTLCPVQAIFLAEYGHIDFVVATRAYVDVYMPLIAYLREN